MMMALRLTVLILAMVVSPAAAHAPAFGGSGFLGGLAHPVAVPAHLLALIGLGLLAGQQKDGREALLVMFALGLVAGLLAIALAAGPSSANRVLTVAALAAGAWTAWGRPLPPLIGWPLMSVVGAAIGLDSPPETASLREANRMLIGTGLTATLIPVVIAAAVSRFGHPSLRLAVRIAGSWVAATAILVLALVLVS
jgi:hydrogenase/urease accessory protein HupE